MSGKPLERKAHFMMQNFNSGGAMLEEMTSLFQPDSLLPVQYFENFRRKMHSEPEKRLLLAVLEDALACYQKHFSSRGGRGMKLFRETEEWIFREDILDTVRSHGPLTAGQLAEDEQRTKDNWGWNWSDAKTTLEYLFYAGAVTASDRRNFER